MRNLIKLKPSRKTKQLATLFLIDGKIEIIDFRISKKIGEEINWQNGNNKTKIFNRSKMLQTNKFTYEQNKTYSYKDVTDNLNKMINNSDNKLKALRQVIEIFEGFNCVGNSSVRVEIVEDNKQINLKEFVEEYLKN